MNTIVGAPASEIGDTRAGDHRLGGSASLVDARTAYMFALDQRRRASRLGQSACQGNAGLPGADDHRIIVLWCCHVPELWELTNQLLGYRGKVDEELRIKLPNKICAPDFAHEQLATRRKLWSSHKFVTPPTMKGVAPTPSIAAPPRATPNEPRHFPAMTDTKSQKTTINSSLFEAQASWDDDAVQPIENKLHQQREQGRGNCAL
jgi:hypothetical protein